MENKDFIEVGYVNLRPFSAEIESFIYQSDNEIEIHSPQEKEAISQNKLLLAPGPALQYTASRKYDALVFVCDITSDKSWVDKVAFLKDFIPEAAKETLDCYKKPIIFLIKGASAQRVVSEADANTICQTLAMLAKANASLFSILQMIDTDPTQEALIEAHLIKEVVMNYQLKDFIEVGYVNVKPLPPEIKSVIYQRDNKVEMHSRQEKEAISQNKLLLAPIPALQYAVSREYDALVVACDITFTQSWIDAVMFLKDFIREAVKETVDYYKKPIIFLIKGVSAQRLVSEDDENTICKKLAMLAKTNAANASLFSTLQMIDTDPIQEALVEEHLIKEVVTSYQLLQEKRNEAAQLARNKDRELYTEVLINTLSETTGIKNIKPNWKSDEIENFHLREIYEKNKKALHKQQKFACADDFVSMVNQAFEQSLSAAKSP